MKSTTLNYKEMLRNYGAGLQDKPQDQIDKQISREAVADFDFIPKDTVVTDRNQSSSPEDDVIVSLTLLACSKFQVPRTVWVSCIVTQRDPASNCLRRHAYIVSLVIPRNKPCLFTLAPCIIKSVMQLFFDMCPGMISALGVLPRASLAIRNTALIMTMQHLQHVASLEWKPLSSACFLKATLGLYHLWYSPKVAFKNQAVIQLYYKPSTPIVFGHHYGHFKSRLILLGSRTRHLQGLFWNYSHLILASCIFVTSCTKLPLPCQGVTLCSPAVLSNSRILYVLHQLTRAIWICLRCFRSTQQSYCSLTVYSFESEWYSRQGNNVQRKLLNE